ncbi:MAG: Ferric enterobactin receptor [Herbaspirillum frisingense]|uniref:Ferric enterobactin receptor n=1 Tax=Herbaspirillum frisingense TaxID=92645 RepID=A0A7V8FXB9_9BURK|nr:MAG: Ferric enterobactin receptor [Herbaspirillum frisingense]
MQCKLTRLSLLISGLFMAGAPAAFAQTTDVGTVTVQGNGGTAAATGLIQAEESPKARSSVNRDYMEKQSPTGNPYQMINLLPGVNTYDNDGSGLFGGNIRVRGFNSDQLGFTINGAPVNDSGSYAVYPQEYTDAENLYSIFVTQGSTDTEAPHVGATGGNIGMTTCAPEDKRRFRVTNAFGSNSLWKRFVRFDSGKLFDDKFKFFVSYSKTTADKFKGPGGAIKDHVDFGANLDLGQGSFVNGSFLYNKAVNNNYRSLTKAQIAQFGPGYDFGSRAPVHATPVAGTAQNDTTLAANSSIAGDNYYAYSLNPFENWLATVNAHFQLSPTSSVDIDPYFWYGFGTGGNQLQTVKEGGVAGASQLGGGARDVNGDGDRLDTVYAYEGSRTKTFRPGVTIKFNQQIDNHKLMAGYWYERARHQQTGPFSRIDSNGNISDMWQDTPDLWLRNADGSVLQYRDTMTISTGKSAFLQDSISMLNDKLNVQVGARYSSIDRDFTNYPSTGSTGGATASNSSAGFYTVKKSYSDLLPSLGVRFQLDERQSVFFNAAKNFKAPGNFSYFGLLSGGSIVGGQLVGATQRDVPVDKETSWNYDLGYRYNTDKWMFSSSLFFIDYKNRIASAYNPVTASKTDFNVGDSTSKGFELESGYALTRNLSLYGSLSYIKSKMKDDMRNSATQYLPTADKEFPDTPNWLSGLSLQYQQDGWYVFGQAKYTGKRYSTLVNDDSLGGYTLFNAGAGATFASTSWMKNPTVRLNVFNLFDKKYLNLNGGSGSQFTTNAYPVNGISGSDPTFYIGAPRTFTVTLTADF